MNILHPSVAAEEIDHGRDEDEVFRYNNGGAHIYLQTGVFNTSGGIQGEPGWIKGGATRQADRLAGGHDNSTMNGI